MDPQKRTWTRRFPLHESVAQNEPGSGSHVLRFTCEVVISPGVWGGVSLLNLLTQFVTYRGLSVPVNNLIIKRSLTLFLAHVIQESLHGFYHNPDSVPVYFNQPNALRDSWTLPSDVLPPIRTRYLLAVLRQAEWPLLTFHGQPHILDKTIDNLKNLRCDVLSLILGESI